MRTCRKKTVMENGPSGGPLYYVGEGQNFLNGHFKQMDMFMFLFEGNGVWFRMQNSWNFGIKVIVLLLFFFSVSWAKETFQAFHLFFWSRTEVNMRKRETLGLFVRVLHFYLGNNISICVCLAEGGLRLKLFII